MLILNDINVSYIVPTDIENGINTSDYVSIFAVIISFISIIISYYSIYLGKKLEIDFIAFEKLAIENISKIFEPIDNVFDQNNENPISNNLTEIVECLTDLELFLISFKEIYKIDVKVFIYYIENFSDSLFINPTQPLKGHRAKYLILKTKINFDLYNFVKNSEVSIIQKRLKVFKIV